MKIIAPSAALLKEVPPTWTRERKIEHLLTVAKAISSRFISHAGNSLDAEDLYSIAAIAVINAVDDYDPARNARLTTHVVNKINWAILQAFQHAKRPHPVTEVSWIPVSMYGMDDEISFSNFCERHLVDPKQGLESVVMDRVDKSLFWEYVRQLPSRERDIVTLYVNDALTMRQIGEQYNLQESRISQIISRAVKRMKAMYCSDLCKERYSAPLSHVKDQSCQLSV